MKFRKLNVFVLSQLEEREFKKIEEGGIVECIRNNGIYIVKKVINNDGEIIPVVQELRAVENAKNKACFIAIIDNQFYTTEKGGKLISLNDKTNKELEENGFAIYNSNGFNYRLEFNRDKKELYAYNLSGKIVIDLTLLQSEVATTNF